MRDQHVMTMHSMQYAVPEQILIGDLDGAPFLHRLTTRSLKMFDFLSHKYENSRNNDVGSWS